jgi:zinc and cadmium transporter
MSLPLLIVAYSMLIAAASLLGGWLPSLVRITHVRMQTMMSLVSGVMLGIAMLHMAPQAMERIDPVSASAAILAGILVMFFLVRLFHVHGHGGADHNACEHDNPERDHVHSGSRVNWMGLYFGLAVHTLLDGIALAASTVSEANGHASDLALFGFGTFLAVLLHKPLDALAITSLMRVGGWSERSQSLANFSYALMCPLGALAFWFGVLQLSAQQSEIVGYALAFSAGFFACIAMADLLPEVQFHSHHRLRLSAALLFGVLIAIGIEMTHSHKHASESPPPHTHADQDGDHH